MWVGGLALIGGCAPSLRMMHQNARYFERCQAADYDSRFGPEAREGCWARWLEHYSDAQPATRVRYARVRLAELERGQATPTLPGMRGADAVRAEPSAATDAEPAPDGVEEEPPEDDGEPSPEDEGEPPKDGKPDGEEGADATPAEPDPAPEVPFERSSACTPLCRPTWESCARRCEGQSPSCLETCEIEYRTCLSACH